MTGLVNWRRDKESQPKSQTTFRLSAFTDIFIPFAVAVAPAVLFSLLGFVAKGLDKPGAEASRWVIVAMVAIELAGILAMAIVFLSRYEYGFRKLSVLSNGTPTAWRRMLLTLALGVMLLFNTLVNIAAAFAGAEIFLLVAGPAFITYVVCFRLAFAGL